MFSLPGHLAIISLNNNIFSASPVFSFLVCLIFHEFFLTLIFFFLLFTKWPIFLCFSKEVFQIFRWYGCWQKSWLHLFHALLVRVINLYCFPGDRAPKSLQVQLLVQMWLNWNSTALFGEKSAWNKLNHTEYLWTTVLASAFLPTFHQQTCNDTGLFEQAWPVQDGIHGLFQQGWSTATFLWYHSSGLAGRAGEITTHKALLMNLIKRRSQNPGDA